MAPLGKDVIHRGPYAVFVPQNLNLAPTPNFAAGHLPLWLPAEQAVPSTPTFTQPAPENQDHVAMRLRHIHWMFTEGRFEGALLALTDPDESLGSALDRQLPGLDLSEFPALFLPVWRLDAEHRTWLEGHLPLLRQ
ncbi:MAG: hypothetical protein HZB56_19240 [Deltaproteobacteria bacterium]|nr:hypothetical protein [Deltaproteobacteria bacterium]